MILHCAYSQLDLSAPIIMGILNVTPDSFSDGGRYHSLDAALQQAETMIKEGAAIIDVGGESTRPGAVAVSMQQELDRVLPVITALKQNFSTTISVDTRQPEVMRAAIAAGAGFINDVDALQNEQALKIVAASKAAVCLMHKQGEPATMQLKPHYEDVVVEVNDFLAMRITSAVAAGISRDRIVIDPGFGFGKNLTHNLQLLKYLDRLQKLKQPVLVGLSRKAMIGNVLGLPVERRLYGSLALAVLAIAGGASIIRTHDVAATLETVKMANAVINM